MHNFPLDILAVKLWYSFLKVLLCLVTLYGSHVSQVHVYYVVYQPLEQ